MKGPIAWFAGNPVAANLLMVIIMAGGVMSASRVKLELFPEFSVDVITVTVPYPGAAPEEVEESVCVKIEEKIQDLEGIKRLSSTARENAGTVAIEVLPGYEVRELMDDVKSRVDAIDTFPAETEKPVIQEIVLRNHVASVTVWGDADELALRKLGEKIREDLLDLPDITQVELTNVRPYEISIEVSEHALRKYGLSFDEVSAAVRRSSLDLPGGSVKTGGGEILLRTKGQAYTGDAFRELVLLTREDGTRLKVGDVATVVDGFEDTDQSGQFNGKPAVTVKVFKVGSQNLLAVARSVKDYVADAEAGMPEGVELTLWQDQSHWLEGRLNLLIRNARAGLVLVFIVLALFLRLRLAFWVSLGIPISFLGALLMMPVLDVSMNMVSMFAFILVLGIVVDDAIVVGESIHTEQGKGGDSLEAAIRGTRRVAVPVIFAILTTVAAFLPMVFLPGVMGKFIRVIPLIVIPTVLFSLVESKLILPAHLAHRAGDSSVEKRPGRLARLKGFFAESLLWFAQRVYQPVVATALRWRYATVAGFACVLLMTVGLIAGGRMDFTFFPKMESEIVVAQLTMPQGTSVENTARGVRQLEQAALALREQLRDEDGEGSAVKNVITAVGDQPVTRDLSNGHVQAFGSQFGEVTLELAPTEARSIGSSEISRRWRERTGLIADAVELSFIGTMGAVGKPIDIQLSGSDLNELRAAADRLKEKLGAYPGIYGISDSFRAGKKEVKLSIKPTAEALGLSLSDLARQVRQGFYGEEAQRIQRGRDDVAVMIRYTEAERRTLAALENMRIRTADGAEVPFATVAEADYGRGYASIKRTDRRRTIDVTADVDTGVANANEILSDLARGGLPEIRDDFPSVKYSLEGEQKEQQDSMSGMFGGFLLSLLMIYALMAVPFKSYTQPLIVMAAIPFGLVGAIWGHVAMGMDLSVMSVLGMVALAGVAVNDSLVLVDYVNRLRRDEEVSIMQAARQAGVARFRPILLTSMTTFAGLLPILCETSLQAKFLIPMAVSLGFGVLFATVITLVLVPSAYLILEDLKAIARWVTRSRESVEAVAVPA